MKLSSAKDPISRELTSMLRESLTQFGDESRLLTGRTSKLLQGERRRVAVLFLDLTGFTGFAESVDHETLHEFLSGLMGFLSSIVDSCGGYVDKIEGDRIMALFGARSAAENDSARAVGCGLRMMDLLKDILSMLPEEIPISARVGVHFGPVTVAPDPTGHLTATGSSVNLASRIENVSRPGSVTVSEDVRRECGDLFSFRELGIFKIEGIGRDLRLFVPDGPGRRMRERWERGGRLSETPLVNREKELGSVLGMLHEKMGQERSLLLLRIRGEAGIGKSRLLHRIIEESADMVILHGHAGRFSSTPYKIWIDVISDYLDLHDAADSVVRERLMELAAGCRDSVLAESICRMVDVSAELLTMTGTTGGELTVDERMRRTAAIRQIIEAVSCGGDVLIALEDVQWMDEVSHKVLQQLIQTGAGAGNTMIVVTERPNESSQELPEGEWELLELRELGESEISSISSFLLSEGEEEVGFDEELLHLLTSEARGNPFYAEELVLSLLDAGGIERDDDGIWRLTLDRDSIEVPSAVKSLIQSRLDWLPAGERKTLQLASVIGESFDGAILAFIADRLDMEADLETSISNLIRKGHLSSGGAGSYYFRHDLVNTSVYETLLLHNRKILHSIAAQAYIELYPEESSTLATVIYDHWRRTDDTDQMIAWGLRALWNAGENEQFQEMKRLSNDLLRIASEDTAEHAEVRYRAYMSVQSALSWSGMSDEALQMIEKALEEARFLDDPSKEAVAIRQKMMLLHERGELDQLQELFSTAMEKADEAGDELAGARVLTCMANHYSDTGEYDTALEYYQSAQKIMDKHHEKKYMASLTANMANLMSKMGMVEESMNKYRESIELCRELGTKISLGYSLNGYAIMMAMKGDLKEARALFLEALQCQREVGNVPPQSSILTNLGVLARMEWDLEASLAFRLESLQIARATCNKRSEAIALVNVANILRLMGDHQEAVETCSEGLKISRAIDDLVTACHALSIIGMSHLQSGMGEEARSLYAEALQIVDEFGLKRGAVDDFDQLMEMLQKESPHLPMPGSWY